MKKKKKFFITDYVLAYPSKSGLFKNSVFIALVYTDKYGNDLDNEVTKYINQYVMEQYYLGKNLDRCDENGNLYEMFEYHPCPFCNTDEFMKQQEDNEADLDEVRKWIDEMREQFS